MKMQSHPLRIVVRQSPNETQRCEQATSAFREISAFVVSMTLTVLAAAALLPGTPHAARPEQRATAVVVARVQIVSGVRVSRERLAFDQDAVSRTIRLPKPRERPCPDTDTPPCRLIVVDMP